ncbi:MAG: HesA/MoeB/ThiF family protein, partial [Rhodocyclaceae bacterium]|nr:HesA/MoeB/ThiF family protein [Rhodocyclaceae bacterium]
MDDQQLLRYSRHILLPEIGVEGQEKLLAARVLVIGAGGLGSPAALYLASAGIGTLALADGDTVDLTNLQRQILHRASAVDRPKAESGRATLGEINPGCHVEAVTERLSDARLEDEVGRADVILDCCDNFVTRHAVNRACVKFRKPLVSGAAIRFDGQVAVFDPRQPDAPCYHCLFPEGEDVEEVRCAV